MAATFEPEITGIVLPVVEAAELIASAHVTLLAPFGGAAGPSDDEVADAADFFAEVTPFNFTLVAESRFPSGSRYLCPEPAGTFRRMTQRLHEVFPEYPPYRGVFEDVVPHVTIPDDVAVTTPIRAVATHAALMRFDAVGFRILRTFAFGTSAA